MTTPRICLNMIVKNEAAILERCLASVAPHIACCVIADTGSTDGTQDLVRRFFEPRGIPGQVVEFPFRNFEQARNQALDACRASPLAFEYILLTDADMELVVDHPPLAQGLIEQVYTITQKSAGGLEYANVRLIRRDINARYVGATHEVLVTGASRQPRLTTCHFLDHACGSNRATKFERDVALLTDSLRTEPNNPRTIFYLANSYFDLGRPGDAMDWYRKRIALGGWPEEVFYSNYRIGLCHRASGNEAAMLHQMLLTFDLFPARAEPLHVLAEHCMRTRRHRLGYMFASQGTTVPKPADGLFVESDVYEWRLLDLMAVCGYYVDRKGEALRINERLLKIAPAREHARIHQNLAFCKGTA